jgi:hypothetical protein
MLIWVVLGMYVFKGADRRNYSSIFLLIDLGAIIMGCYYSLKSIKEKNSVYKIIGISLNGIYIAGILYLFVMNIIDVFNFAKVR